MRAAEGGFASPCEASRPIRRQYLRARAAFLQPRAGSGDCVPDVSAETFPGTAAASASAAVPFRAMFSSVSSVTAVAARVSARTC